MRTLRCSALGGVAEHQLARPHGHVFAQQRRQAVGAVLLRVLLTAGADHSLIKDAHGGGEHALPASAATVQIGSHGRPQLRQPPGQRQHPIVFLFVAGTPPLRVVEVLPPSGGVDTDGLYVP